jgi:hypothetical protein
MAFGAADACRANFAIGDGKIQLKYDDGCRCHSRD